MDDDLEVPSFTSTDEELNFWKQKALEYRQKTQEIQDEFDEFQESSRMLEAELEAQLEQAEKQVSEVSGSKVRIEQELTTAKEKMAAAEHQNFVLISSLTEEARTLSLHRETLQNYVRELEQTNDDLERAKRNTVQSLDDFEKRLNEALERNALLEHELDEKESLNFMVQRLKDETRDLRHELAVRPKVIIREVTPSTGVTPASSISALEEAGRDSAATSQATSLDSSKSSLRGDEAAAGSSATSSSTATEAAETNGTALANGEVPAQPNGEVATENREEAKGQRKKLHRQSTSVGTTPLPPSTRLSALGIVSDLLRKVGMLETKLSNARSLQSQQASTQVFSPIHEANRPRGADMSFSSAKVAV
ncbi:nuclear distribution protein nudE-like 1 [Sycon ciliatum]|uniref:nuclear distribution protein nudE-like 1 n=1 Tax=Sycon ciliatum TaxID=27933 RepID=UPI0020ACFE96|eukprot:scpid55008/ scgid17096/ Nuclear distribution protein nudE-like 1-B